MKKYIIIILLLLPALAFAGAKSFQVDSGSTLTTSLVSYYKLEDATDFYGSNNLTAAGNASFVAGKVNNAVTLDGTDDYLDGGDVMDFDYNQNLSLEAWIYPDVLTGSHNIISKYDDVNDRGYTLMQGGGDGKLRFMLANSASNRIIVDTTNIVLTVSAWNHIVVTYGGATAQQCGDVKIYVNNSDVARTCIAESLSATTVNAISFNIGSANDGAYGDFDGLIDETGVWSKVLTITEVADLYNGGSGQTMIELPSVEIIRRIFIFFFQ